MCGIAGFAGTGTRDDIVRMTRALAHRGPDGDGLHVDGARRVFLGHRRLAIIDIAGGVQPMANDTGTTTVVFNGEIYNHRSLRRELVALGQKFRSDHSDTEVIIRGYDQWGQAVVERLEGMFAFAIYDAPRGKLLLARDRFGEKPLFYAHRGLDLAFASEVPSLRLHPIARDLPLDPLSLQKLFAYSFLPGDSTPYSGMKKVLPGSYLLFDTATGHARTEQYWRFRIVDDPPPGGIDDWVEELRELLRLAVVSRLESDVPIGVFLSGGIDSSAIAALASESVKPSKLSTFTIGFIEPSFDERAHAEAVAASIGSKHDVQICDLDFMRDSAGPILSRTGDLLGDPSLIPTTLLSAGAARHVKVALSGDGGDELFAGYDPFKALSRARLYQKVVPRVIHSAIRSLAAFMPMVDSNMSLDFKVRRTLRGLSFEPRYWNPVWLAPLGPDEIAAGFEVKFDTEEIYSEAIALWDSSGSNDVDRTLEFFTCIYLPDNILVKSDRAGMMNSLEIRAPFLSLDLVEFVRRLPANVKYRNGTTKWILKEAVRSLLPPSIVDRRKKGFGIPVAQWLRDMDGQPSISIEGLREATFDAWDAAHRARREDQRGALWCRKVLDHHVAGENANLAQAN